MALVDGARTSRVHYSGPRTVNVLRLGGIAQDRPRQAIRLVEVLVGQPDEGGVAEPHVWDACRCAFCAFCQLDGL